MSTEIKICPKCGGENPVDSIKCAYCGFYNDTVAMKNENAEMAALKGEHETKLKKMPKELVRKNRRKMFAGIAAFVVLVAVVIIVVKVLGKKVNDIKYDGKQDALAELEEMYAEGRYDELFDAYYNGSFHGESFGKYENTADIAKDRHYAIESLNYCYESNRSVEELSNDLYKAFRCLHNVKRMRDKGFIYGEGEAVEKLEAELIAVLKDPWGLTDEDIKEATEIFEGKDTDYTELAERVLNGM